MWAASSAACGKVSSALSHPFSSAVRGPFFSLRRCGIMGRSRLSTDRAWFSRSFQFLEAVASACLLSMPKV